MDESCGALFDFVENIYEKSRPMWFESRGCKKDQVDVEVTAALSSLHIAQGVTNLKEERKHQQSEYSMFSMVMFSKHRREHMKHYGKYVDNVWRLPP